MDYQATLRYLDEVQARGIKLGLETMRRLLAAMGDPQQAFPAVVVGGTNGKGSVCAFLASILKAAGLRAGLYTSPHLVRYEERIAVDGAPVSPAEFAEAVSDVRDHVDSMMARASLPSHPTHFEILTAAAYQHFRRRAVDAAVLEVGMGGRLDAVATARTAVAAITNVRLEHTRYLGATVEEIAREKAGIIGEGCRLITAETLPAVLAVLREEAAGRGARLIERDDEAFVARWAFCGDLALPLAGRHQVENAALAVLAAEALAEAMRVDLPPAAVAQGLARARWPGRLQIVGRGPLFLLDGAHNPAGCEALAQAVQDLRHTGAFRRLILIFGVLQDKELLPMAGRLFPLAERAVVTRGRSARFRDPEEVAAAARAVSDAEALVAVKLEEAIETARSLAAADDAICLCGSLYLVGDAMRALGIDPFP